MIKYNVYNNNIKINKRPLSKSDLDTMLESNVIYKKQENGETQRILAKNIQIVECIII